MNRGADEWGFPWGHGYTRTGQIPGRVFFLAGAGHVHGPPRGTANTLTLRIFRPPLPAKVKLRGAAPSSIRFPGTNARVRDASGPWRSGGEWWCQVSQWKREDWDIGLVDGGQTVIYRIFQDYGSGQWFMEGMYD
jgi:protein ImuB